MKDSRGFTLIEVVIASSIFLIILFAGISVSKLAVETTQQSTNRRVMENKIARVKEAAFREIVGASLGSLEAIPAGLNMLPEPMAEGTEYRNILFRRVISYSSDEPVYDPPLGTPPRRIVFQPYNPDEPLETAQGDIVMTDTDSTEILHDSISDFTVVRNGRVVDMSFLVHAHDANEPVPVSARFVLKIR